MPIKLWATAASKTCAIFCPIKSSVKAVGSVGTAFCTWIARMAIRQKIALNGRNLVREFDQLKSRPPRIEIHRIHNPLALHDLRFESMAGTQCASHTWNEVTPGFGSSTTVNPRPIEPASRRVSIQRSNFPMIILATTGGVYYPVVRPPFTSQIAGSRRVQYVRRSLLVRPRLRSKSLNDQRN